MSERLTRKQFAQVARVLAEPRRVEMLKQIAAHDGPMPCQALLAFHNIKPATVSHHVNDLEVAGLIATVRHGRCMDLILQRDVLRAYLDELSEI